MEVKMNIREKVIQIDDTHYEELSKLLSMLNDNMNAGRQALIDISDNAYQQLSEFNKGDRLKDLTETMGSISYNMSTLLEVCIECKGKDRLKYWHREISNLQEEWEQIFKIKY